MAALGTIEEGTEMVKMRVREGSGGNQGGPLYHTVLQDNLLQPQLRGETTQRERYQGSYQ